MKDTSLQIDVGIKTDPEFTWPDTTVCLFEEVQFMYTGGSPVEEYYWFYDGLSISSAS